MEGDHQTMNKINFASNLHVGKYPKILNQPYFFVFNEESSVSTYDAVAEPKMAATTLKATQLAILIEIFNSQSRKTPTLILPKKKPLEYSNKEIKLLALLQAKKIKYITMNISDYDNSFDNLIKSEQENFNSYISKVETCLPVLSDLKSTWTIIS
jgi:hypothetical protein